MYAKIRASVSCDDNLWKVMATITVHNPKSQEKASRVRSMISFHSHCVWLYKLDNETLDSPLYNSFLWPTAGIQARDRLTMTPHSSILIVAVVATNTGIMTAV